MSKQRILVVDDELDNRVMMRYFLESWGYEVELAENGKDALAKVSAQRPDLILLDLEMPVMNGFDTCHRLKSDPATEPIPVIMFTGLEQTADKVKGIKKGADDYVVKTVDPEELQARIEMILRRARRYEAAPPSPANGNGKDDAHAVSGNLAELYFPEAMQLIFAYGKSGVLRLQDGDREGAVYLRDGKVVHAEVGDRQGEAAFYELALWKSGHFSFDVGVAPARETIDKSGTNLLIEATRRLDEWNLISGKIPSFEAVPRRAPLEDAASIRLCREDWRVLRRVDGRRSIRAIAEAAGLDEFAAGRAVFGLLTVGVLRLDDPATAPKDEPALRAVPHPGEGPSGDEPVEITAEQWRVLARVDGRSTVGEIAEALGLAPKSVVAALGALAKAGFVDIAPPRPRAAAEGGARRPDAAVSSGPRPRIRAIGLD